MTVGVPTPRSRAGRGSGDTHMPFARAGRPPLGTHIGYVRAGHSTYDTQPCAARAFFPQGGLSDNR